jgi:hypothetical protein
MRSSSPRWVVARSILVLSIVLIGTSDARAIFVNTGSASLTSPANHDGLAFDGTNWHIANPFTTTYHNYSSTFTYLGDTNIGAGFDLRGMAYDPNTNHLFTSDDGDNIVREVTTGGTIVSQFNTGITQLNAVAFDRRDNTIWLAYFTGRIEKRTRTGALVSSFTAAQHWTGLALDPVNNTLLAMDDPDTVYEFRFDGTALGPVIPTDQLPNNGLGLAYDASIGRLYATSQTPGVITFFDDPSRVPEPGSLVLAACAAGIFVRRRRGALAG